MIIANAINFDNTKSVRDFAKTPEAQRILNEVVDGKEKQLYSIGQTVNGEGHGFYTGKIIDVYCQCGYYRYVIEYKLKPKARKTFTKTLRQIDIKVID